MSNPELPPAYSLERLLGEIVVLDLASPYVYLGRLVALSLEFLVLEEADCHDLRDTNTTREKYVLDCRRHGLGANRRQVWVNRREIVGISRLEDVVEE